MGETVLLRSRTARALGATMVVVALAGLVSLAVDGGDALVRVGAPVVLFGVLGWAAFWEPNVEVSDGGVRIANTLRTVTVPWPAIEDVDGRYGLRLRTAYGVVNAWGAPAPVGRQRARGEVSAAARAVEERLEQLRAAGFLDDRRLEGAPLTTTWHLPVVVAVGALAAATVVLPLLA